MTYVLAPGSGVTIPRRPMVVTASLRDAPATSLRLSARSGNGPAPDAHVPRPGRLVLRDVTGPLRIRVTPAPGADTFPAGAVLNLRVRYGQAEDDGEEVSLRGVELSGRTECDLVELEPAAGDRLTVTALVPRRSVPLGELATAARTAARARLGRDRTADRHDVVVAVDRSASMAPWVADGRVRAAVDLVVGLSQVLSEAGGPTVVLTGARPVPVEAPVENLAAATEAVIARSGVACGFRSLPTGLTSHPGTITYVVTDDVPPDRDAWRSRPGELHVLVCDPGGRPPAPPDVRLTVLPPAGTDMSAHLLRDHGALAQLVGSMLPGDTGAAS